MDHRPFNEWLLENKPLTAEEKQSLHSHLQTCTSCSALTEVDLALKSVKLAAPAEGFGDRFKVRLAAQRKTARQRNTAGFILLTVSVLAAVTWLAWPYLGTSLRSPAGMLSSWMTSLFTLWTDLRALLHAGWVVVNVVPSLLWALFVFTAATSSLVWALSLVKLNKVVQGVQS
jgi:hypothetical protein